MGCVETKRWTCANCRVEVRWANGHERSGPPSNWIEGRDGLLCLSCRRQLAADTAVEEDGDALSIKDRAKVRSAAIIDFEVRRDPSRSNAEIAHCVHSSVVAIQKARERLGVAASSAV